MDFTRDGGCIETGYRLKQGSTGWLQFPTLSDWPAQVAWRHESRYGLAFARPFHAAVMAMLVARADGTAHVLRQRDCLGVPPFVSGRASRREKILAGIAAPISLRSNEACSQGARRPQSLTDTVTQQFRGRIGTDIDMRLRGISSPAVIVNVDLTGVTVKSAFRPYIGESVVIALPQSDPISGTVAWWQDGCFAIHLA